VLPPCAAPHGSAFAARGDTLGAVKISGIVPSVHFAIRVEQDNSLDRLIVPGDPDHIATQEFEQVFGSGEFALLLAEADDPYAPAVLARVDGIARALAAANSLPLLRWNSGAGGVDSDHEHDGHSTPAARDVSGPV
jgi:hypothetical protein